jgi:hypothetical protein
MGPYGLARTGSDMDQWRPLVNTVMNLPVPLKLQGIS